MRHAYILVGSTVILRGFLNANAELSSLMGKFDVLSSPTPRLTRYRGDACDNLIPAAQDPTPPAPRG